MKKSIQFFAFYSLRLVLTETGCEIATRLLYLEQHNLIMLFLIMLSNNLAAFTLIMGN
jgi:hypothetical protein